MRLTKGWVSFAARALRRLGGLLGWRQMAPQMRLMGAILDDDPKGVSLALEAGADANAWGGGSCELDWTPVGFAALHGKERALRALLPRADVSKGIRWGANEQTALMAAASSAGQEGCVEALLPMSDPNARDSEGMSALMIAVESDAVESALMLAPRGPLDAVNARGASALALAAREGNARLTRALLASGANPLLRCHQGKSALMEAAISGVWDCVEALVGSSDPSARCRQGLNAAEWARRWSAGPERERVSRLLEAWMAFAERDELARCAHSPENKSGPFKAATGGRL